MAKNNNKKPYFDDLSLSSIEQKKNKILHQPVL